MIYGLVCMREGAVGAGRRTGELGAFVWQGACPVLPQVVLPENRDGTNGALTRDGLGPYAIDDRRTAPGGSVSTVSHSRLDYRTTCTLDGRVCRHGRDGAWSCPSGYLSFNIIIVSYTLDTQSLTALPEALPCPEQDDMARERPPSARKAKYLS